MTIRRPNFARWRRGARTRPGLTTAVPAYRAVGSISASRIASSPAGHSDPIEGHARDETMNGVPRTAKPRQTQELAQAKTRIVELESLIALHIEVAAIRSKLIDELIARLQKKEKV